MTTNNDIPVAQRVTAGSKQQKPTSPLSSIPWWGYSLAVLAFFLPLAGSRFWLSYLEPSNAAVTVKSSTPEATLPNTTQPVAATNATTDNILGHLAYVEAPLNSLRTVGRASDGYEIRMRASAAKNYQEMVAAARANGIELVPISGFRTKDEQRKLFFEMKANRNQTAAERAMVSAPPGYSEHHTGYAIDIGDGVNPSTNLSPTFDKTEAFKWLDHNAAKYSFELSFPANNKQGVMYEPWHWRFVGDDDSLATFYKANSVNQSASNSFIKSPNQPFIQSPQPNQSPN